MRLCFLGALLSFAIAALGAHATVDGGTELHDGLEEGTAADGPDTERIRQPPGLRSEKLAHISRAVLEEIEPWHLYENAGAQGRAQPLEVTSDGVHRGRTKQPSNASGGNFFYHPNEYSVHESRKRREPEPDGTSYWYPTLFHHTDPMLGPERPKSTDKATTASSKAVTVAVYYYPWYHTDFHGRKYIRGELNPPQMPVLGEYDDRSPKVISQHLEWSREANIDLWVASWWGPQSGTDITIRDYIMPHPDLKDMKLCLFYETMGRVDVETLDTSKVFGDISYAAETYFAKPNYYKINGRPVLFVYLTRSLEKLEILARVLSIMRTAASKKGHQLYIVGDHTHSSPPEGRLNALDWLDAITNYDIFGAMGRPNGFAKRKPIKEYSREQAEWKRAANMQGCAYIPGATPGYNDKAVREGEYNAMVRKLGKKKKEGSLFRVLLREGKKLVDGKASNILVVNSFNEWHEDTQIEPVKAARATTQPWRLTRGRVYRAYGELYLNILKQETEPKPKRKVKPS